MKSQTSDILIVTSSDGSHTLWVPELNEHYHSQHGAVRESRHVFLNAGYGAFPESAPLRILEIGWGTGLNCLLTLEAQLENGRELHYTGMELFPLDDGLWPALNYPGHINRPDLAPSFSAMHRAVWHIWTEISPGFHLYKWQADFVTTAISETYNLIYFDAFGFRAQEEMWTSVLMEKLFAATHPGGMLVTYAAKGQVRRNLQNAGYTTERLPGPPGKREMLRATRPR